MDNELGVERGAMKDKVEEMWHKQKDGPQTDKQGLKARNSLDLPIIVNIPISQTFPLQKTLFKLFKTR